MLKFKFGNFEVYLAYAMVKYMNNKKDIFKNTHGISNCIITVRKDIIKIIGKSNQLEELFKQSYFYDINEEGYQQQYSLYETYMIALTLDRRLGNNITFEIEDLNYNEKLVTIKLETDYASFTTIIDEEEEAIYRLSHTTE